MTFLTMLLKPFFQVIVGAAILLPIKGAVMRYLPDGRLKRLLLFRLN